MLHRILGVLALVALAGVALEAGIKVKVTHDETFDFKTVRTYAWHPDGAGEVKVLHTLGDDVVAMNAALQPMITNAVDRELAKRGLVPATSGTTADVYLHYYLLLGPESESQYAGQFIGGTPEWGLPAFSVSTTGLTVAEHGTLVIDLSSVAEKTTIWRGIAKTEVRRQLTSVDRERRIGEGVTEMFKKYPPKPKKR